MCYAVRLVENPCSTAKNHFSPRSWTYPVAGRGLLADSLTPHSTTGEDSKHLQSIRSPRESRPPVGGLSTAPGCARHGFNSLDVFPRASEGDLSVHNAVAGEDPIFCSDNYEPIGFPLTNLLVHLELCPLPARVANRRDLSVKVTRWIFPPRCAAVRVPADLVVSGGALARRTSGPLGPRGGFPSHPLHRACAEFSRLFPERIQRLIDLDPFVVRLRDEGPSVPLHDAAAWDVENWPTGRQGRG